MEGTTWDPETGDRLNADGTPTKIPREQWEKHIVPGLMNIVIANTDPKRKLTDTVFNIDEAIANMPADAQGDIGALTEQRDQMKAALGDKTKMATAYGRQAATISQALLQATSTGMNANYIKVLERGLTRAEKKADGLTKTLSPREKAKYDKEMANLGIRGDVLGVQLQKEKRLSAKALSGGTLTKKQKIDVRAKALSIFNAQAKDLGLGPDELTEYRKTELPIIEEYLQPQAAIEGGDKGPTILTGDAAIKKAESDFEQIKAGKMDAKILLDNYYRSGQVELGRHLVELLEADLIAEEDTQTGERRYKIGK